MAERVVDFLESVEIKKEDGEALVATCSPSASLVSLLQERLSVGELGQGVTQCAFLCRPPCHERGDACSKHIYGMKQRPSPRRSPRFVVIEHVSRSELSEHSVVEGDIRDRQEEYGPVAV